MIILFYLPDGDKGHAIGDTWESKVALPNERETYRISSTLKAVETLDGANAAVIEQIISREDDSEPKISVESRFAVDDGRLLKSRVSYTIPDSSGTDGSGSEAAVVTDIQLAK
jgi:hypothetical protein